MIAFKKYNTNAAWGGAFSDYKDELQHRYTGKILSACPLFRNVSIL